MRVFTSYFYQVRFFKPYMIPLSTAVWDPKWYHAFKSQDYLFYDKNGVINGLRYERFMPGSTCSDLCRGRESCSSGDYQTCNFLKNYQLQLDSIPINEVRSFLFTKYIQLRNTGKVFDRDPIFVFLVHETPTNPCSERRCIQKYFQNNRIMCPELNPKIII